MLTDVVELERRTMPIQVSSRFAAFLLILLFAASFLSPSAVAIGGDQKETVFFGTGIRADTVVFVVDMSGSMNDGGRFERAVHELVRSLNAMAPTQKFFVFFFNGETHPMLGMRSAEMMAATPANRAKVVKWIKTLRPDNDTAPEEALKWALKLQPQVIYFLTDGEIPDMTGDTVKKFNHEHKTVIHTIAIGTEEGAEMLRAIAHDNGGKYQFVP
jgi:hypothetical protein